VQTRNVIVLAKNAAQRTAGQKHCSGALSAADGRFLAVMRCDRGDAQSIAFPAFAGLMLGSIDAAVVGAEAAVLVGFKIQCESVYLKMNSKSANTFLIKACLL